jgi:cell filamentation protein
VKPEEHPYCYPGTDVLRNKEDIRDKDALEAFERAHSADRLETLSHDLPITVAGFCEIHRYMLQDVYDWAGEYRTVNTGRTAPFCKTEYIAAEMDKRFAAINGENNLHNLTPEQFASRAAEHINEINAIHPFLDGNGRAQRAFLQVLAEQAGHEIDLARIDPQAWNDASVRGFYQQDHRAMCTLLADALIPTREQDYERDDDLEP